MSFCKEKIIIKIKTKQKLDRLKTIEYKRISHNEFEISVFDCIELFLNDRVKIEFVCDDCGRKFCYNVRAIGTTYKETNLTLCKKCIRKKHTLELTNGKYSHTSQMPDVIEKYKASNMKKYGVSNPAKNHDILQKMKDTCMERYGFEWGIQSEESKEKKKDICLKIYGVENPMQIKEINSKRMKTTRLHYNERNGASMIQVKLSKLFHGECEVRLKIYRMDIEYDGEGHFLFRDTKDVERRKEKFLLENYGIKTIRFIAPNDKVPDDDVLLKLFEKAKQLLLENNTVRIYLEEDNRMEWY